MEFSDESFEVVFTIRTSPFFANISNLGKLRGRGGFLGLGKGILCHR